VISNRMMCETYHNLECCSQ